MKPSKLLFIVAIAASFFLSSGATRAAEPGVYMLFVWGTATSGVRDGIEISEKKLEAAFDAAGLTPSSRFVKGCKTLKGSDATGPKILSACREMADAAGPNDAILVYILAVGATLEEPDGRLRYALAPCASSPSDLQLARDGIARDAIMATLKSKPRNRLPSHTPRVLRMSRSPIPILDLTANPGRRRPRPIRIWFISCSKRAATSTSIRPDLRTISRAAK